MGKLLGCCNAEFSTYMRAAEESKYSNGRIIQCFIYLRNGSAHDNHCESSCMHIIHAYESV